MMIESLKVLGWVLLFFLVLGLLAYAVAWAMETKR
jgi:hypothetical protein